jgi:hypothetical protein
MAETGTQKPERLQTEDNGHLDPARPGALDLLGRERRAVYDAAYRARPDDEHPAEKHATAWRAAVEPNRETRCQENADETR